MKQKAIKKYNFDQKKRGKHQRKLIHAGSERTLYMTTKNTVTSNNIIYIIIKISCIYLEQNVVPLCNNNAAVAAS